MEGFEEGIFGSISVELLNCGSELVTAGHGCLQMPHI